MRVEELKPCPFCGAIPKYYDAGDYEVDHKEGCYLLHSYGEPWIFSRFVAKWENRYES